MRIRTIKPEFFTHEGLFEAEQETKLPIRIAFAGLWCVADREGRFKWEPRRIGVQVLPYDAVDFSRVLDALVTRGFIVKYRVGNECFGAIPSFQKHQVINNRESASNLPEPCGESVVIYEQHDASVTRESRDNHAGQGEGKGREGNKEGKGIDITGTSNESATQDSPSATKAAQKYSEARLILQSLNEITGRHYRETQTNLDFIHARLSEPEVTVEGCIEMIRRQTAKWKDDAKMSEFLRPETLFNRTKFDSYYASKNQPILTAQPFPTHGQPSDAIARRNSLLGDDVAEQQAEAARISRAKDEAAMRRFEATGLTPWD